MQSANPMHDSFKPSCDISQPFNLPGDTTGMEQVPAEKVKAMQEYAARLARKHPHMKKDRLTKKVADYFKVKLV